MIAILDAAYSQNDASAACVAFEAWEADRGLSEHVVRSHAAANYEPGAFYKRELPLLLDALKAAKVAADVVIIDGYVWLDAANRPGLGAHLHAALGGACAVVGVAKTAFAGADAWAASVIRGAGKRPLYVTAVGISTADAAAGVRRMHGAHRIPMLMQRVDRLARDGLP